MTRGKIFAISFFTSLIVSAGVFILMYLYVVPLIIANQKFSLPNVTGAKLETVKLTLESKGLNFSLNGEENDPLVSAGSVLKQEPLAGTLVKKNDIVKLVVSKGKKMAAVPNVLNMPVEQAAIEITKAGLIPDKMDREISPAVPKGYVISLDPQPGASVDFGTKVNLLVSGGQPKTVKAKPAPKPKPIEIPKEMVPDVVGKYFDEAQKILESKGFKLGKLSKSYSDDQDFDIVLSQYPKAGMSANKGSEVKITINSEVQNPNASQAAPVAPAAPVETETVPSAEDE
ncbi:MAG: PASTA domain-containing protein [Elusimicrobiota bacterium]